MNKIASSSIMPKRSIADIISYMIKQNNELANLMTSTYSVKMHHDITFLSDMKDKDVYMNVSYHYNFNTIRYVYDSKFTVKSRIDMVYSKPSGNLTDSVKMGKSFGDYFGRVIYFNVNELMARQLICEKDKTTEFITEQLKKNAPDCHLVYNIDHVSCD